MGLRKKFRRYCYEHYPSLVKIQTTNTDDGSLEIGTGFHLGDGYIATARHVAANNPEVWAHKFIGSSKRDAKKAFSSKDASDRGDHLLSIKRKFFPGDSKIDVAVLETDFDPSFYLSDDLSSDVKKRGHFSLQLIYDEDFYESDILLRSVLIMGYPPIPQTYKPHTVAVAADINAVVSKYTAPYVHLILSSTARGGFSGAPVVDWDGRVIAICTESLNKNNQAVETGFTAAIQVQALNDLLVENKICPISNAETLTEAAWRYEPYKEWKAKFYGTDTEAMP